MIKVDEKYYIDADGRCYTLKEKLESLNEKNKFWFKELGYYTTLESLLNGLIEKETREFISESKDKSIEELLIKIKELEKYFKEKLGEKI